MNIIVDQVQELGSQEIKKDNSASKYYRFKLWLLLFLSSASLSIRTSSMFWYAEGSRPNARSQFSSSRFTKGDF